MRRRALRFEWRNGWNGASTLGECLFIRRWTLTRLRRYGHCGLVAVEAAAPPRRRTSFQATEVAAEASESLQRASLCGPSWTTNAAGRNDNSDLRPLLRVSKEPGD